MQVETRSPRDVDSAELEALIEEARRRARRRRIGMAIGATAALLLIAALAGLVVTGGDGAADDPGQIQVGVAPPPDTLFLRAITENSERILAVDTARGEITDPKLEFYCGDQRHCLIASGNQLAITSLRRTTVYDPSGASASDERVIAKGWYAVPSVDEGRVWLSLLARDSSGERGEIVEVDLEGNVLRRMDAPGPPPVAAVSAGPLFQVSRELDRGPLSASSDALRLWDMEAEGFTMLVPGSFPLGASGDLIATCHDRCQRMVVADTETGTVDRIAPPSGFRWRGGYGDGFSPQGPHVAAPLSREGRRPAEPDALGLVDVASGHAEVIPGSSQVDPVYGPLAWSPDGQRLYFTGPTDVVRSYSVGASGTERVAGLEGGGSIMQLVATGPGPTD